MSVSMYVEDVSPNNTIENTEGIRF